jgi:MoxR-like ATPase
MADAPQAGAPAKPVSRSNEISKSQPEDVKRAENLVASYKKIKSELSKLIVGQDDVIEQLLIAVLAKGHCLLEGVPGLAKTLMVRGLSQVMTLSFRRIQFTPDLMPADITGTDIIQEDPQTGRRVLNFQKGPIFAQMLLADEINRTPPKTQAALLEAMQEHSVTVGGNTYPLEEPFFCSPSRTRSSRKAPIRCPKPRTGSCSWSGSTTPSATRAQIVQRTTGAHWRRWKASSPARIMACQETVRARARPRDGLRARRGPQDAAEGSGVPAFVKELVEWGAGPRLSAWCWAARSARCSRAAST